MVKFVIPELSEEELLKRYEKVKPVHTKDGQLYAIREFTPYELSNISYTWGIEDNLTEPIQEGVYEPIKGMDFQCLHTFGYPGFFKASIAEVLRQMTERDVQIADAFEIISRPERSADFGGDTFTSMAFRNNFHVSTVRLYRKVDKE